jgi:two-component system nitrogen regulation response regulator GlnG
MQRAAVLATADVLLPKDIPLGQSAPESAPSECLEGEGAADRAIEVLFQIASGDPSIALLPWIEREFTLRAMRKTNGNQVRAAKMLGITRATLRKRMERNGADDVS